MGADGQVTMDKVVLKHGARKLRRLGDGQVLAGFAGATADAFTLFEKFEGKLKEYAKNQMAPRVLLALTASWALGIVPARAEEHAQVPPETQPEPSSTGLPAVRGLDFQFSLVASWGNFGFLHSFYANPHPDQPSGNLSDNWFEGAVKPGLTATYAGPGGWQLYGKISAAGERTYCAPPTPVGESASSFQLDDLYLG